MRQPVHRPVAIAGCDTLVALGAAALGGSVLFAKNSDRPPGECQPLTAVPRTLHANGAEVPCQYVRIPQVRETALVLGSRPSWLWGFEHGVNEHGVAIGNETVFAREAPAATGLLGMDLVRLGLERAASARQALEVITELLERHGQGGSGMRHMEWPYNNGFLIADPVEAWILETAGRQWAARPARATDAISNQLAIADDWRLLSRDAVEHARSAGWVDAATSREARFDFAAAYRDRESVPAVFSEGRLRRSRGLLERSSGKVTVAALREILRDHHGAGRCFASGAAPDREEFYTLCMHEGPSRTAASMVAELEREPRGARAAWVSLGRPCASVFFPVLLTGDLPQPLTEGTDEPSEALWWVFERLAAAAEADRAAAARIRDRFDALQARLDAGFAGARGGFAGAGGAAAAAAFMAETVREVETAARAALAALR